MVVEAAKGKNVSVYITTFYQEGGAPEFDSGIKEWMNANPDALTNNGGNDMVSAVTAMGYDAYFTALRGASKAAGSTEPGRRSGSAAGRGLRGRVRPDRPSTRSATPSATRPTSRPPTPRPANGSSSRFRASSKHRPQTAQTVNYNSDLIGHFALSGRTPFITENPRSTSCAICCGDTPLSHTKIQRRDLVPHRAEKIRRKKETPICRAYSHT